MVEIWKVVACCHNSPYRVSNMGRVGRCIREGVIEVLPGFSLSTGYRGIALPDFFGKYNNLYVHRLVADAFIPNPEKLPLVNHKDENKQNNHVENLEWCTNQYNSEYSQAGRYWFTNPAGVHEEIYNLKKFCRERGLNRRCMQLVYSGKQPTHKGWTAARSLPSLIHRKEVVI